MLKSHNQRWPISTLLYRSQFGLCCMRQHQLLKGQTVVAYLVLYDVLRVWGVHSQHSVTLAFHSYHSTPTQPWCGHSPPLQIIGPTYYPTTQLKINNKKKKRVKKSTAHTPHSPLDVFSSTPSHHQCGCIPTPHRGIAHPLHTLYCSIHKI